ncbi:MAG TPA: VTT domain-containing protein, partial [Phycisphaerales bacterium]|nr:VTT domain-containing protein [Phycisphaerales bacterium]
MLDLIRDIFSFADPEVLGQFVRAHGPLVYLALFGIVFAETGLVVTPFLPGDSLLFAAGAVAALGDLGFLPMAGTLIAAAVLGDAVNYAVGRRLGPRIFRGETRDGLFARLVNRGHLESARRFFEKHGGKAVVLARFVPIVRTFVPFVAGAGTMNYRRF